MDGVGTSSAIHCPRRFLGFWSGKSEPHPLPRTFRTRDVLLSKSGVHELMPEEAKIKHQTIYNGRLKKLDPVIGGSGIPSICKQPQCGEFRMGLNSPTERSNTLLR